MKTLTLKINTSKRIKIEKSSIGTLEGRKQLVSQILAGKPKANNIQKPC